MSLLLLSLAAFALGGRPTKAEDDKDLPKKASPRETVTVTDAALKIHREAIVIDGHNDLPWRLRETDMEFRKLDLNGDGFITPPEALRYLKGRSRPPKKGQGANERRRGRRRG